MTLPEQSAIILDALDHNFVQSEHVIRWADELIATTPQPPPYWLIELSTLPKLYKEDVAALLRQHAKLPIPLRQRIELVALAWDSHKISLNAVFPLLFKITILDRLDSMDTKLQIIDETLHDVLVEWDSQEDLDVIDLRAAARMEALLRNYASGAYAITQFINLGGASNK